MGCGQLAVRQLTAEELRGAALLVVRSFAGSPEAVKLEEATDFMQRFLEVQSQGTGTILAARLVPADPALLPPSQPSRLVGTVGLSFAPSSRADLPAGLPPPEDAAYLSNMAVDPKLRRQGVAMQLLQACELAARAAGLEAISLHVRAVDGAAQALYAKAGYAEVGREKPGLLGGLMGSARPRVLMRKQLRSV